jgi:beta-glucosidase/6-phospho-beta-glucosidase/beta-galactosidase
VRNVERTREIARGRAEAERDATPPDAASEIERAEQERERESGLDAARAMTVRIAVDCMGGDAGPKTDFGWEVWPNSLRDMILRVTKDYGRRPIEITENGCSYADGPDAKGVVRDTRRTAFYAGYLEGVHRAIEAGAAAVTVHGRTVKQRYEGPSDWAFLARVLGD